MRFAPRALFAGGLGFAVAFLVACGGGAGLLTSGDSSNLNSQLDAVSSAVDAGHCGGAISAVAALSNDIANLPRSVSRALRANLEQGASTVSVLAQRDCSTSSTTGSTSTSTSTTTSSTTTAPSTSTSTTTPTSTSTSTTPATSTSTTGTSSTTGGAGIGGGQSGSGGASGNGQ